MWLMRFMSELLENKIDLLIEKVQEELSEISYQLKVANDLKKVEIAHKMKLDIENGTDVDLVKASLLIDKIIGYLEYDYDFDEDVEKEIEKYDDYLMKRYKG